MQSPSLQSSSSPTTTNPEPGFEIYENPTFGITIQYPINSKVTEKNNNIAFTLPQSSSSTVSSSHSYVIVTVSDLQSPEMSLDQYTNITLAALGQTRSGFNIVGEKEQQDGITLSNNPAHALIFTDNSQQSQNTNQQDQRKTMQIWTVSGDKSYNIAYISNTENFDANLPTVQQMIKSFQITSLDSSESLQVGVDQQEPTIQEQLSEEQQQEPQTNQFANTNQELQEDDSSGQITSTESDSEQTSTSSFPSSEETDSSSFDNSASNEGSDRSLHQQSLYKEVPFNHLR